LFSLSFTSFTIWFIEPSIEDKQLLMFVMENQPQAVSTVITAVQLFPVLLRIIEISNTCVFAGKALSAV